jgi:putative FmdB family regulatory protein
MPLFDYRCVDCKKRFSLLVAEPHAQVCPACGSANIGKLVSRFARLRSEDDIIDALADPSKMGDLEDPKQLQSWMKRMGKEMGEDLGDDFEGMMDEMGSEEGAGSEEEPV